MGHDSHYTLVNMTATNVQPGIWTGVSPSCMKEGWDEIKREREKKREYKKI